MNQILFYANKSDKSKQQFKDNLRIIKAILLTNNDYLNTLDLNTNGEHITQLLSSMVMFMFLLSSLFHMNC